MKSRRALQSTINRTQVGGLKGMAPGEETRESVSDINLLQLPTDALERILMHVRGTDLLRVGQVCRKLRQVSRRWTLWRAACVAEARVPRATRRLVRQRAVARRMPRDFWRLSYELSVAKGGRGMICPGCLREIDRGEQEEEARMVVPVCVYTTVR